MTTLAALSEQVLLDMSRRPQISNQTRVALTEPQFYDQLKAGGISGWNDQYWLDQDIVSAKPRFFLKFYDVPMASVELIGEGAKAQTRLSVFGIPSEAPVATIVSQEVWTERATQIIAAIKDLRIQFK